MLKNETFDEHTSFVVGQAFFRGTIMRRKRLKSHKHHCLTVKVPHPLLTFGGARYGWCNRQTCEKEQRDISYRERNKMQKTQTFEDHRCCWIGINTHLVTSHIFHQNSSNSWAKKHAGIWPKWKQTNWHGFSKMLLGRLLSFWMALFHSWAVRIHKLQRPAIEVMVFFGAKIAWHHYPQWLSSNQEMPG